MKKILFISLFLLSSLLFGAEEQKMIITDVNGKQFHVTGTKAGFKIDEAKGKVVFLEYFGHMCPPCMASIPHYIDLTKKYKDKFEMFAIEAQGYNDVQLKELGKKKGINYHLFSTDGAGEFYQYVAGRAGWKGAIPFLVVTDPKGNVKFIKAGYIDEADLEQLIQKYSK